MHILLLMRYFPHFFMGGKKQETSARSFYEAPCSIFMVKPKKERK